jgi:ubiquinone/menaquinone biosynthesis C-methylase UbiE
MLNDHHKWREDGDEWKGQARLCGVPYDVWKQSLVDTLILPNIAPEKTVIEIGPGRGRWSAFLAQGSAFCTLVDISPNCLQHCRDRFSSLGNIEYFLTPGTSLPHSCTGQIDFVWSYDAFVHMAPDVVALYLSEIARVLRPDGVAILHHANIGNLSSHVQDEHPGWRSAVDNALIRHCAEQSALRVDRQFVYWDEARKIGVPNFGDSITVLRRE